MRATSLCLGILFLGILFLAPACAVDHTGDFVTQDKLDAMLSALADTQTRLDAIEAAVDPTPDDQELTSADIDLVKALVAASGHLRRISNPGETWTVDATGADVPPNYTTVEGAVAALDGVTIDANASVTIQIAPGDYRLAEPLLFRHPDGGRVSMKGDTAEPEAVNLYFSGDGIQVREASALGYLGGLSLRGEDSTFGAAGLQVAQSSHAVIGPMRIDSFGGPGIAVSQASSLHDVGSDVISITNCGWEGVSIEGGSAAYLPHLQVSSNGQARVSGHESGVSVRGSSYLSAPNAWSDYNIGYGYEISQGSFADLPESEATANGPYGYAAYYMAGINAPGGKAIQNDVGFYADEHAFILATNAVSSVNTIGFTSYRHSFIQAQGAYVEGSTSAFWQTENGLISARDTTGERTSSSGNNDTTVFILLGTW